ncbi:MAG TPA: hypothetical protein VK842_09745 [bacterium]|jgi:hypothetical protein|nr:hypothetical protein [bacterium]
MLIPSFALTLFLCGVTWMTVNRELPPPPVGGPIYYAIAPDDVGSIQPRYRLTAWQAFHSKRHIEAFFDDRCLPLMAVYYQGRTPALRRTWLWDHNGRLRRRLTLDAWGRLMRVEDLEP